MKRDVAKMKSDIANMKRDIVNYTILTTQIRVRVNIGIAYEADIHKAKEIIIDIARRMDWTAVPCWSMAWK